MFAPARAPAALIARLNTEIVHVLNEPDARQRLLASGAEPVASTAEELMAEMQADIPPPANC